MKPKYGTNKCVSIQQDSYMTNAGGAVKTMCITPSPFSKAIFLSLIVCLYLAYSKLLTQELSYRKQIARKLHIQHVEGIYRPKFYTATLKSHTRTVVRECCKGDNASQWRNPKFDPPPRSNPKSDSHKSWQR